MRYLINPIQCPYIYEALAMQETGALVEIKRNNLAAYTDLCMLFMWKVFVCGLCESSNLLSRHELNTNNPALATVFSIHFISFVDLIYFDLGRLKDLFFTGSWP